MYVWGTKVDILGIKSISNYKIICLLLLTQECSQRGIQWGLFWFLEVIFPRGGGVDPYCPPWIRRWQNWSTYPIHIATSIIMHVLCWSRYENAFGKTRDMKERKSLMEKLREKNHFSLRIFFQIWKFSPIFLEIQ